MTERPSVVVVGGGAAGLAAAIGHESRGFRVTLVEARTHLGGRAWSFVDPATGFEIDNGPHVLLGCYRAFRRLLRALGSEEAFFHPPALELTWLREGGEILRLTPPALPAPLHLLAGFLRLRGLELPERMGLCVSGIAPFLRLPPPHVDVAQWMRTSGHNGCARSLLFDPLCRAVMNDEPERCEAALFLRTLREAFLGGRGHSAMWVPTAPWGQILDEPARDWFERTGSNLHLGRRVVHIERREGAPAVHLDDGRILAEQARVVLALPWQQAAALDEAGDFVQDAGKLAPAPLVSVHLQLPAGAVPFRDPIVALLDGSPFHFLCRRPDPGGIALTGIPACMLAGGALSLDGFPAREIVTIALRQLAGWLGRHEPWPDAVRETATVLRESRATIAPCPGQAALRPKPGPTAMPGLWLCGDWTDTGLPSTLEGAARSAFDPLDADCPR